MARYGTTITAPLLFHLIVTQVRNGTLSVQPLLHHYFHLIVTQVRNGTLSVQPLLHHYCFT